jgi:hypothetical protein
MPGVKFEPNHLIVERMTTVRALECAVSMIGLSNISSAMLLHKADEHRFTAGISSFISSIFLKK